MTYLSIYPIFRNDNQGKKVDHFEITFDSDVKVWVFDLFQMYMRWAANNDIEMEIVEADCKPIQSKCQTLEYLSLEKAILHLPTIESNRLVSEAGVHSAWKASGFHTGHHEYLALVSISEKQPDILCTQEFQFLYNLHAFNPRLLNQRTVSCVREYCLKAPPGIIRRGGTYTSSLHPHDGEEIYVDYYAPENGKIEPFLTSFSVK